MLTKKEQEKDAEAERLIREALETEEGRTALFAAMTEPLRCGGMEYVEGKAIMWFGGIAYPYDEFMKAYHENGSRWPSEWVKNFKETRTRC